MKNLTISFVIVSVLAIALANVAVAVPVALQNPTAVYSQGLWTNSIYSVAEVINGTTVGTASWGQYNPARVPDYDANVAVFETVANMQYNQYTFRIYHHSIGANFSYRKIQFSYTTADRSTFADNLDRNGDVDTDWNVLAVKSAKSLRTPAGAYALATINPDQTIDWTPPGSTDNWEIVTQGIGLEQEVVTGFRLDVYAIDVGDHTEVGYASGNALLTEMTIDAATVSDPIPEPATLALLGTGGVLALLRRRR